jgi:IS5 family transposase
MGTESMKPKPQPRDAFQLFQAHFDQILNPDHALLQLARKTDWSRFDVAFADSYSEDMGAPAKAIRLMVGLHYLKYTFNKSDEMLVEQWVENPYWQAFCGYTHMQHEYPIDPSSMSRWRGRVGADRLEELLKETIALAVREKQVSVRDLQRVNIDTTVQEKNVTFPTDSKLLHKVVIKLGAAARSRGIRLRQSYVRVAKRAAIKAGRYAHAKQYKRMRKQLRKLRTYVGRLIRDIQRKVARMDDDLTTLLLHADRIRQQQPKDSHKLYSLHEPEVQCISKGKAHKRYEFGQKVAIATTNGDNWVVASPLMKNNPYDGHTLAKTIEAVEWVTGIAVTDAYVDKGYRGHDYTGAAEIHVAGQRNKGASRSERKRRRRRSAVEPKIGHLKSDHRMDRCFLAGLHGDAINAVLAAAGSNMRKLLRRFFFVLVRWLRGAITPPSAPCVALEYAAQKLCAPLVPATPPMNRP